MFVITYKFIITLTIVISIQLIHHFKKAKNKGSPETTDIYLSAPLLWSFLLDLVLSSILKLFI